MARQRRSSGGNLFLDQVQQAVVDGLREGAEEVLKESKDLVPLEDGGLRRSGRVEQDYLLVSVVYRHPLAYLQHENLDWQHDEGRQAKYLEQAGQNVNVPFVVGRGARRSLQG